MNDKLNTFYLIAVTLLAVIVSFSYSRQNPDDEYIFYTYAKNISQGKGYTFNEGERINATTSPLYTLLISSMNFITGPDNYRKIPLIGKLISFFSLLFLVYFVLGIMKESGFKRAGYLFALLILVNPYLKNSAGMETQFELMLAMGTVYFYVTERFELTAIAGALAFLARFDNILLIIIILIHCIIIHRKLPNTRSILLFFIIVLPWFLFSYFYFNSILPTTLNIKVQQHMLGYWGKGFIFIKGFITTVPGGIFSSFTLTTIFIICLSYLFVRRKPLLKNTLFIVLLAWSVLYFISYGFILNPPAYPWYYSLFVIPFGLVVSITLESFLKRLSARAFLLSFIIIFLGGLILPIKTLFNPGTGKYNTYLNTAKLLNKNKDQSSVLIDEIGIFGFYYTQGKVIDLLGLINPEIVDYLKQKDYGGILLKYDPDFVVADYPKRPSYENFTRTREFINLYSSVSIISDEHKSVEIYRKK